MIKLREGTWMPVADSDKALILANQGDAGQPDLAVRRRERQDNQFDREQSTSRPGRMNEVPGVHRAALADTDWHELEKQRFAADIADLLCELAHRGLFSGIVLVAAPRVLGFCGAHPVIP